MDQAVIRGHAGLPGVEELAEGQAAGGEGEVGGLVHDHRAFASQLQGDGGQVAAGLFHDLLAHGHAAGEEDVVEGLFQQGGVLVPAPFHGGHPLGREDGGQQLGHGVAGVGGVGAGLEDHAVARRHRAEERLQAEQIGIVPGGHDQHHPVRLGQLIALGAELGQGRGPPLGPGPPGQVFGQVAQLVQAQAQLGHVALEGGFVQVGPQGGQQLRLPLAELVLQPFQRGDPHRRGPGGAGVEEGPLAGHDGLDLLALGVLVHAHTSSRMARMSS